MRPKSEDQLKITFSADRQVREKVDEARGAEDLGRWLRETVIRRLQTEYRIKIDDDLILSPDRTGKGGRPKKAEPISATEGRPALQRVATDEEEFRSPMSPEIEKVILDERNELTEVRESDSQEELRDEA